MRQIENRKYIRYSSLGNVVGYYGDMGSGRTLGAVIQIVKELKSGKYQKVLSNIKLNVPQYEPLILEKLLPDAFNSSTQPLTNSIVFIDNAEISGWLSSRVSMSKVNRLITYFLAMQRRFNNLVILTARHPRNVDLRIRNQTTWLKCNYIKTGRPRFTLGRVYRNGVLAVYGHIKKEKKYFKYFDTFEIPNPPFLKSEEDYNKEVEYFLKKEEIEIGDLSNKEKRQIGILVERLTGSNFPRRF